MSILMDTRAIIFIVFTAFAIAVFLCGICSILDKDRTSKLMGIIIMGAACITEYYLVMYVTGV